jgi:histidyl-tRNA synthetase
MFTQSQSNRPILEDIGGFPEFSPEIDILMERIKQEIAKVYKKYGYQPIDNRLVEQVSVLEERGIDGKEVFCLSMLHKGEIQETKEEQETLALRFDFTVPLARYIGQAGKGMVFPFKRYQIGKVYRGEAARPRMGRFCEFYQSDIDVIGNGKLDLLYDAEMPLIINDIFKNVFGLERFIIRISNRKLLEGLFQQFGVIDPGKIKKSVNYIDNMEKVPIEETIKNLEEVGISKENADLLFQFFNLCRNSKVNLIIQTLRKLTVNNELLKQGISEVCTVLEYVLSGGINPDNVMLDPRIARGLDYYTDTVYETLLIDLQKLGSVCSGGRYEDLVGTLSRNPNMKYPGCGISIGLSRLVPALAKAKLLNANQKTTAKVMISTMDKKCMIQYQKLALTLRENGIDTIVYCNDAKLKNQLNYADAIGVNIVIVANEAELNEGKIQIKDMWLNIDKKKKGDCVNNTYLIYINEMIKFIKPIIEKYEMKEKKQSNNNFRKYSEGSVDDVIRMVQQIIDQK